jgi:hypothetical protein
MKQNEIEIGMLYKVKQFPRALYVGAKFPDGLGLIVIDGHDSLGNRVVIDSMLLSHTYPYVPPERENYELDETVKAAADRVKTESALYPEREAIAKTLRPFFEIATLRFAASLRFYKIRSQFVKS